MKINVKVNEVTKCHYQGTFNHSNTVFHVYFIIKCAGTNSTCCCYLNILTDTKEESF